MEDKDNLNIELKLLEELESVEVRKRQPCFFGIGTDPVHYDTESDNPYMQKHFSGPMTADEIAKVCSKEKLGRPFLFSFVDGSKI